MRVIIFTLLLLSLGACGPEGDEGGRDCRRHADACADGFVCIELREGDWDCRARCERQADCDDEETCDRMSGACLPAPSEDSCVCMHARDGRVGYAECGYADVTFDPNQPDRTDNLDVDPRDPAMRQYFATRADYMIACR